MYPDQFNNFPLWPEPRYQVERELFDKRTTRILKIQLRIKEAINNKLHEEEFFLKN
jgi:hypothetical protein